VNLRRKASFARSSLLVVAIVGWMGVATLAPRASAVAGSRAPTSSAAQGDLGTALTAARSYYTQNNQTFTGLITSFGEFDTGLTVVAANVPAAKAAEVSVLVSTSGNSALMAAWGSKACWAIVDITDSSTYEGFSGPATFYLMLRHVKKSACSASTFDVSSQGSDVVVSTNGSFPTPPPKPGTATQNLLTTLTGERTYWTQNNQSYSGLDPTSFVELDTGLTAVAGNVASTKGTVISLLVPGGGNVVLSAVWDGSNVCLAIIDITDSSTLEGFVGPGTIYVSLAPIAKAKCSAVTFDNMSKIPGALVSTTGFG
jgi:hypothetical protein